MKVYSVTHKDVKNIPYGRTPIGVGPNKKIKKIKLYDNTGDNISQKNASFCELTALYWIWKNTNDEYVGLEHYRRTFYEKRTLILSPIRKKKLKRILGSCDIVLPQKSYMPETVFEQYKSSHIEADLKCCEEIIKEKYPEFLPDYKKVMENNEQYLTNMFVAKKILADEYCEWLFDILFEAEKRIDITGRDAYQTRVFGFLSERLFNVWILHKQLKINEVEIRDYSEKKFRFRKIGNLIKRFKFKGKR